MDFREFRQEDGSIVVTFDDKPLTCVVCSNTTFHEKGALLNTRAGEWFNFAWAEDKATNFVCTKCGYVFWFLI